MAMFGNRINGLAGATLALCMLGGCASKTNLPEIDLHADRQTSDGASSVPQAIETLCRIDETAVFSGDVQDDLGLTISVCLGPKTDNGSQIVSVRSEGEGGGIEVSCEASKCENIVEFEHYRRPRFTILTLKWIHGGSIQRLVETNNAEDVSAAPDHSIMHSWSTSEARDKGLEPESYPVSATTEPLSLLKLDGIL